MESFEFDIGTFNAISEEQDTDLSPLTRHEVRAMFPLYPELAHWSHFAFFVAWSEYSQDIHAISWVDEMTGHLD